MKEKDENNNEMHKLFLAIGKTMPEDMICEEAKNAIEKYQHDKSKKNKDHMKFYITMFSLRLMTEDDNVEETLQEFDKHEKIMQRDKIINS